MDFFPRPGKGSGAWCSSLRPQSYDDKGEKISPITYIVCNFSEPVGDSQALLSLDETETFFHEFGHAIHNLFADVPYRGLLGVERDFVELPSQIMENWAFAPEMLAQYAIHYRTGEPIPDRIVRRMGESALFNQGFATTELLAAALSDMDIHSMREFKPFDVAEFEKNALTTRRGLIPQIEPRYHYPYFSHIFDGGYSAGYYGYIWAEVLDKDAYAAFAETGDIFNRNVANEFRHKVLAPRGMRDGMDLYLDFRGAEPSREAIFEARGLNRNFSELSGVSGGIPVVSSGFIVHGDRGGSAATGIDATGSDADLPLRQAPPDSVLRVILGEGPLEE
jgi:peptidyl-dipeptidase Dcp